MLSKWNNQLKNGSGNAPRLLAYRFDKAYDPANLSLEQLEGNDLSRFHAFKEMCDKEQIMLYFGDLLRIVSGWCLQEPGQDAYYDRYDTCNYGLGKCTVSMKNPTD